MRRTLTLLTTVAILIGLVAAPAAADKPIPINFDEPTIFGVNPCTELPHEIQLRFEGYEHFHQNNYVRSGAFSSGSTSDGYVMDHGREHWVISDSHNNHSLNVTFHNTWSNDGGSKFAVTGIWRWDFDTGENRYRFNARCIKH